VATLLAIGYADPDLGEVAQKVVQELEDELVLSADHVASIARDVKGRHHAHISHRVISARGGVDWGGFWRALFDLLGFVPSAGLALPPERRGGINYQDIDQDFKDRLREQLKPGTSAVFLMIEHGTPEKAVEVLQRYGGRPHDTWLSTAELGRLRKALAPAAAASPR
jgi:uncharacterized membrane protein